MAASIIGALRVVLGLDSAQFTEGMTAAQKELAKAGKQFQAVGKQIGEVGQRLTVGLTLPLAAVGASAVKMASDVSEAQNVFQTTFKNSAKEVEAWSDKTATALGRSRYDLQQTASTFGLLFTKVTPTTDAAAKLSERFAQLSLDLSSFYNASEGDALTALRSGLTGEAEPLRAFGVFLSDAKVQAELASMGIKKVNGQFSEEQKILARANIITRETAIAHGDVAKTSGGLANQMRSLQSAIKDAGVELGMVMLPFIQQVVPALRSMAEKFTQLSPTMQKVVVVSGLVAAAIGPILVAAGAIVGAIGVLAPLAGVLLPVIGAVAAVGVAFYVLRDEIVPILQAFGKAVGDVVGPKLTPLFDALKSAVSALGETFVLIFSPKGDAGEAMTNFNMVVSRVFGAVVEIITAALQTVSGAVRGFAALLRGDFAGAWIAFKDVASAQLHGLANVVETLFPEMVAWAKKTFDGVKLWLVDKFDAIVQAVRSKLLSISGFFRDLWDAVVGHSYIPDMVEGVAAWMAKLDAGMVTPAKSATAKTKAAFEKLRDDLAPIMEGLLTDQEESSRGLAANAAILEKALDKGADPYRIAVLARRDAIAHGAKDPSALAALKADSDPAGFNPANDDFRGVTEGINATRDAWGSAFADGIEGVLYGDLKNVLKNWAADWARGGLEEAGRVLFDALKGGGLKKAFSSIAGFFGGGGKLPGFKNGGSFTVGGSAGIDSNLVAFRATRGETVDIRKPGQDMGGRSGKVVQLFSINAQGAVLADGLMTEMRQVGFAAAEGGATLAEHNMATKRRTTLGSGRR